MSGLEHALATIASATDKNGATRAYWICACGAKGVHVRDIRTEAGAVVYSGEEWATAAHERHRIKESRT